MELSKSKSLLAKLMATENLHIEQRNVSTASFDVSERILTIPVLNDKITTYQYDLFIGHEVGHALFTPIEGMRKAREMKLSRSVMNVVEDSRIERKIKQKYPGIRHSFYAAYKELLDLDFFGTLGKSINDLSFIDRINLHCKCGIDLGIVFCDEEKALLNAVENTTTYDDVISVAQEVVEYMRAHKQVAVERHDDESAVFTADADDVEYGDGEIDEQQGFDNECDEEEDSDEVDVGKNNSGGNTGEIVAETDEEYNKNRHKLFSDKCRNYVYGNVPNLDIKSVVIDYKTILQQHRQFITDHNNNYPSNKNTGTDTKELLKFRADSKNIVSYLVKEFELRKNANQMKRAGVAKTGELNMSKVYSYAYNEDIFKKLTIMPDGKSHGLVMFIDWSGSMHPHLDNTIRQLLNLVMFCKAVSIPYEVYAFTQTYKDRLPNWEARYNKTQDCTPGNMVLSKFNLMNLLSSRMGSVDFNYAAAIMLAMTKRYIIRPDWICLSGTPLNEAIVAAMNIVPKFKLDNKLQVVNTVFLTDGDGSNSHRTWGDDGKENRYYQSNTVYVIRDPVTKHEERMVDTNDLTQVYIKLLKARTDAKILGFYILHSREFGNLMYNYVHQKRVLSSEVDKLKSSFRKSKYQIMTTAGYDEYYLLRAEGLDEEDPDEIKVSTEATTRGFVSAFSKFNNCRKSNRVVLNRFIGMIS